MRLAAPGVTGELYIAGPRLARGYANRPGLTAQRFLPDPFGGPGSRMYRTGDLARWTHDGQIEFGGRTDGQVKIRGFRVELSAIEAALTAITAVAAAAVILREDQPGDKRLTAYLVPGPDQDLDHAAVRRHLAGCLPAFMLPAAYVTLPEMPLTGHQKIDRKALPAPPSGTTAAHDGELPGTPAEELLAGLFAGILGLPAAPGTGQDFFALGGHSLLAMRLINQVRAIFTADLTIRDLFDHPTIETLARHLDTTTRTRDPIQRGPRPQNLPLSPAQRRLHFLNQFDGQNAVYNVPRALRLTGALDAGALGEAVNDLIARHETLRTLYPDHDGEPCQHILDPGQARIPLPVTDTTDDDLPGHLHDAATEPFTLATDQPIRARLFRLTADSHVLLLVLHHIATDGWSMHPLIADLATAYHARARHQPPAFPPLALQYADYALWQAAHPARQADLDFWTQELRGLPEETPLPLDRPRPPTRTSHGATVTFPISQDTHAALHQLARTSHATLFITLHTAVATLLHQHGAGTDIALGTVTAGRTDQALDDLIGFFANTLVLRTDLTGDPTFRQLLERTRATDLRAYAHQDLPFDQLVEHLAPARTASHHPLFQVSLTLDQTGPGPPAFGDLTAQAHAIPTGTAKFDLSITFQPRHHPDGTPAGLTGTITYATDIFTPQTITALTTHLSTLLTHATHNPDAPISELEVLAAGEREQLLGWGTGLQADLGHAGLAARFEDQARHAPHAVALEHDAGPVTYAELNARANQLARLLSEHGAGPDAFVAVAMERSAALVTALLAVIKAGAAYVPIPAAYPLPLARDVVRDIGPVLLLTDQALRITEVVQGIAATGLPVITADDPALTLPQDTADLQLPCHLDQAAYVLFTSGSTGTPKGVTLTQGNLITLTQDTCWRGGNHRRVLMHSPHSFDASTQEMWVPLLAGNTVIVYPPGPLDPARLEHALTTRNITATFLTKALFDLLVTEVPQALGQLREIWTGGEEASVHSFNRAAELHPDLTVINGYGPTETTTCSARYRIPPGQITGPCVPVGRPMNNTRVYILDAALRLVPPGVTGELYIAGPRVTRGYANRPGLTAQRFLPDLFGGPGARMYRTGDLARWTHDGQIEFGGRTDGQVKIRGFRVELGAIEAALTAITAVAAAAVILREDQPGDKRLTAYLVPGPDQDLDHAAVHRHLTGCLPAFMLPAAYVTLPEMPLTGHHKVDRKALPAPPSGTTAAHDGELPGTPAEELLAGLFAGILGLPATPGTGQDFFALGGHSLLAMRLINQVRAIFTADLTIRDLFDHPTIETLARHLDTRTRTSSGDLRGAGASVPALRPTSGPHPARIPLSAAQLRLWISDRLGGRSAVYNAPVALRLAGVLDAGALGEAVNDLIARHEILRTLYPDHDGEPCQHILDPGQARIPLPVTDTTDDDLPGHLHDAATEPFTLATDQPIRARLFRLTADSHVLLLVLHHIATDGWSMHPLIADLATAYHARARHQPPAFPPLALQYADYALWQAAHPARQADLDFWTQELRGLPEETPLPLDRPRPPTRTSHGATVTFPISQDTHAALHQLARTSHATLFITLHTAVATLLHQHGAGTDIALGTVTAGRTDQALDDLIGFFANTLVLRTDLTGDPTFRQLLERTRATDLRAYAHQDLPFDQLVEHLAPARTASHHPLFQVSLTLDQTGPGPPAFGDLTAQAHAIPTGTAKFDLSITFQPRHHPDGTPAGLTGTITYATDIFTPQTITALTTHLSTLLTHATQNPDAPISELEGTGP